MSERVDVSGIQRLLLLNPSTRLDRDRAFALVGYAERLERTIADLQSRLAMLDEANAELHRSNARLRQRLGPPL